jgi:hypothetical protein
MPIFIIIFQFMNSIKLLFTIFLLVVFSKNYSQGYYEHEFGINAGFYQLRSDYGESLNNETNFGNQGVSLGFSYFLNKASSRDANYFFQHFKTRIDFMFASVNLEHYGDAADDPRLEAMTGTFSNVGLGIGFDYHPFGLKVQAYSISNTFVENLSPYAGFSIGYNFVSPDAESSLDGGLSNPANIFPTFISQDTDDGINLDTRSVLSLNLRLGLRIDIGTRDGFSVESNWMLFGSDLVDGLSPVGPQNKYNDWSWGINIGYSRLLF